MDFQLTDDQQALQSGIRTFCDDRYALENVAQLEKSPLDRDRHRGLAEMGVFSLRLPEADGGVGLGMAEAVLVFAELGRRVVPGPLLWSHICAGLVPGAGSGETIVGGLDRTRPSSEPLLVEYAGGLDALVVLGKDGGVSARDRVVQRSERLALASDVLFLSGATFAVTSILLYVLREKPVEPEPFEKTGISFGATRDGAFVALRGAL